MNNITTETSSIKCATIGEAQSALRLMGRESTHNWQTGGNHKISAIGLQLVWSDNGYVAPYSGRMSLDWPVFCEALGLIHCPGLKRFEPIDWDDRCWVRYPWMIEVASRRVSNQSLFGLYSLRDNFSYAVVHMPYVSASWDSDSKILAQHDGDRGHLPELFGAINRLVTCA